MIYTNNITSKGQVTLPKEFRDKLGLDKLGKAQITLNQKGEIVITPPKNLEEVRALLARPTHADAPSSREQSIGTALAKKYGVH